MVWHQVIRGKIWLALWHEAACWALTSLAFTAWLVWGPAEVMNGADYGLTHHFFKVFLRDSLWAGDVPLWNPYTLLGRPFLADPEVAAYYPPTWLFIFLPEIAAYWLVVSLHFAIGGWGMSRLTRAWGAPLPASILAGVAFVISPPFLGHLQGGLIGFVCTIAWWPWLLDYTDRLCNQPTSRDVLTLTALLAACFLSGHTHAFWLCGCSLGFYVLPRCSSGSLKNAVRSILRAYSLLAMAAVACLALCAIEFLPLIELSGESNRQAGKAFASVYGLSAKAAWSLFIPFLPHEVGWWDAELYIGVPMAFIGIYKILHLRESRMRALACMALASLGLALGDLTPLFDLIYPLVPAMGSFRFNDRFGMFLIFALFIAAACFWQYNPQKPIPIKRTAIAWCGYLVSILIRWENIWWAMGLVGLGLGFTYICFKRQCSIWWLGLFIFIWGCETVPIAVEISKDFGSFPTRHYAAYSDLPVRFKQLIVRTSEDAPARLLIPGSIVKANSGMINRYSLIEGNVSLASTRVWNYIHYAAGVTPSAFQITYADSMIYDKGPFPYKGANISLGWDQKRNQLILCPPTELGQRAWLTRTVTQVSDWPQALQLIVHGFDPRMGALVEPEYQPLVATCTPGPITGTVQIEKFSRNQVILTVKTGTQAILVLAEAWFPGWQAKIDGIKTEVFPTNVWMRGVIVPAGTHQVRFFYHSTYLLIGSIISLAAFITWMLAWRVYRRPPAA